jgi:hypothetical protein
MVQIQTKPHMLLWIDSLASEDSGIEDQFANRFCYYEGTGSLSDRDLFIQSKADYFDAIVNYLAIEINRQVKEYKNLGASLARNQADKVIADFRGEFSINKKFKTLSQMDLTLAEQFSSWVIEQREAGISRQYPSHRNTAESLACECVIVDANSHYWIKRPKTLLALWLESAFNQSERGKVIFKSSQILDALGREQTVRENKHKVHRARKLIFLREVDYGYVS